MDILTIPIDLPENLTTTDRILVMHEGHIAGHVTSADANAPNLVAFATRTHVGPA